MLRIETIKQLKGIKSEIKKRKAFNGIFSIHLFFPLRIYS